MHNLVNNNVLSRKPFLAELLPDTLNLAKPTY